jgi:pimeloyl-ACP methyl ester carboxylesterase
VVAIDVPGFGRSIGSIMSSSTKEELLLWLLLTLEISKAVFICPSMSTPFCLQFAALYPQHASAVIIVGPAVSLPPSLVSKIECPTLLMYGSRDGKGKALSAAYVSKIPGSVVVPVADADHALYLDNAREYHRVVLDFVGRSLH